jgi:CheY-like chemotaxis protein
VEDDADIRELIADILEGEGFPVEKAANGADALHMMKNGYLPDVVLTNLLMPMMDGYQLHAELKKHDGWAKIPLIVMTAGKARPGALSDVEEVLQQPVDLDHLLDRVRAACKVRHAQSG